MTQVTNGPRITGAQANAAARPSTPVEATQQLIRRGDLGQAISTLGALPTEVRSKTTAQVVLSLPPDDLKKLATTEGVFQSALVFLGTKPYDEANVSSAITALLNARNGTTAAPAKPASWGAAPSPSAGGGWGPKPRVAAPAVTYSGTPRYSQDERMPEGLAQPLSSSTKRYASEMRDGKVKTENGAVNVICDYEVSVKNPKTGSLERVVFEGVQQPRKASWGLSKWYDTAKDVDSKVLACEGHVYGPKELKYNMSGKGPLEQWMSGNIERTSAFSFETIPELKARVDHFKKTGETGNDVGTKRGR